MDYLVPYMTNPCAKLRLCLEQIKSEEVDFILVTGDLVHEGEAADYRLLKDIFTQTVPEIPVIVTLGNHDHRGSFFEGYLDRPEETAYFEVHNFGGLRVIVLDSSATGKDNGEISPDQIDWLEKVLQEQAPAGTLLAFHHPISLDKYLYFQNPTNRFLNLLSRSDVKAIFCGHTHHNMSISITGIPEFVCDSTAFSCVFTQKRLAFTDRASYNLCAFTNGELNVHTEVAWPVIEKQINFDPIFVMQHLPSADVTRVPAY